jgi:geranylgeranylglycerol-phosphate geranylgeranyltransferase
MIRLLRPMNVLFAAVTIAAVALLAGGRPHDGMAVAVAALIGALMTAGANAINDYFDLGIDAVNRPDRPIPSGQVTPREAIWVWAVTTGVAVGCSFFLAAGPRLIVLIAGVVLYVYSAYLKRTILAGNVVVALMIALAFVFGGTVAGHPEWSIVPALFGFLVTFARELIKDVEDVEGDRAHDAATLPVRHGIRPALALITIDLIALVATTITAAVLRIYTVWFIAPIVLIDVVFLYTALAVWKDTSPRVMHRHSARMKLCMWGGLLAIIAGSIR